MGSFVFSWRSLIYIVRVLIQFLLGQILSSGSQVICQGHFQNLWKSLTPFKHESILEGNSLASFVLFTGLPQSFLFGLLAFIFCSLNISRSMSKQMLIFILDYFSWVPDLDLCAGKWHPPPTYTPIFWWDSQSKWFLRLFPPNLHHLIMKYFFSLDSKSE